MKKQRGIVWFLGALLVVALYYILFVQVSPRFSPYDTTTYFSGTMPTSPPDVCTYVVYASTTTSVSPTSTTTTTVTPATTSITTVGTTLTGVKCGTTCCATGSSCYKNILCCPSGTVGWQLGNLAYCKQTCTTGQTSCGQFCCNSATETCQTQAKGNVGTCVPKTGCDTSNGGFECRDGSNNVVGCCTSTQKCDTVTKPTGLLWPFNTATVTGCTADTCPSGQNKCVGTGFYVGYNICCANCFINPNGQPSCI